MRLMIKQRVMSIGEKFDILDVHGRQKYTVKGELLSIGHKFHVYDANRKEIGLIKQKLVALLPVFEIYIHGKHIGRIQRKITLLRPKYEIDFNGWTVSGDVFGWNYEVKDGRRPVANISKKLMSWGDTYTIDIDDPADELMAMMLVIAIDAANCTADGRKAEEYY